MAALPTGDDLKRLPLRGLIAFAARCALRVQPLYQVDKEHPEANTCCEAVDKAIHMALDFAAGEAINRDKATAIEEAVFRAVVVASDEKQSNRKAAFSSNSAYAAINAVTTAIAPESAGSRATEMMRVVMASVTSLDAAVAADPACRHAAVRDFKRLSGMSLGSFPNFGKSINPTGKGALGPVSPSRLVTTPAPKPDQKRKDKQQQKPQNSALPSEDLPANIEKQRRIVADTVSKLAAEREELSKQRKQMSQEAIEAWKEREELKEERDRFALEQETLEQSRADITAQQSAFEENRQRFKTNTKAVHTESKALEKSLNDLKHQQEELQVGRKELDARRSQFDKDSKTLKAESKRLQKRTVELEDLSSKVDSQAAEFSQSQDALEKETAKQHEESQQRQAELEQEWIQLKSQQSAMEDMQAKFEADRQAHQSICEDLQKREELVGTDRAELESERDRLQVLAASLEEQRTQCDQLQIRTESDRDQFLAEQREFRDAAAELQELIQRFPVMS